MIVDPFDPKQGITPSGKPAAQVYFLPPGASPLGDLTETTFVGLADVRLDEPDQAGSDTMRH